MEDIQDVSAGLHEDIKNGRIPDIDKIIKKHPNEKYFYNDRNESAAAVALEEEKIKIYEILISKGLCLGLHEDANEITKYSGPTIKENVRKINKKYSNDVNDHVTILISKSKISHNTFEGDVGEVEKCIRKAFIDLGQIEEIQPILEVIAYADKLSIIFDFHNEAVNNMDPTSRKTVQGVTYPFGKYEGDIFIGGKKLREGEKYSEALGTLAHELTHYAMQLVYQNTCKPYKNSPPRKLIRNDELEVGGSMENYSEETSDEQKFQEILEKCQENRDFETIINRVFSYPDKTQWHAELIVRVPHLLAVYKNDENKRDQVMEVYSELFEYFETTNEYIKSKVLPHMRNIYKMNCAFPIKGDIVEYYIPRKFVASNFEHEPFDENQIIDQTTNTKVILLIDEPGAGKTTNLVAMSSKLKRRYPEYWIAFIDLKNFVKYYERDGNESIFEFNSTSDIVGYYNEKIFNFKNFEAKYFKKLFKEDRVIFLMDGFDEISPSYKEFNLRLITGITSYSENQIWISSRPHLEKELQGKFNCSVFKLSPFTESDRKQFLMLIWKYKFDELGQLTKKIQEVENFLKELNKKSTKSGPILNPLVLRMVADVFDDLQQGHPGRLQTNLYLIYKTFISKKLKLYFKRGPEAEDDIEDFLIGSRFNIKTYHQEKALMTYFDSDYHAWKLKMFSWFFDHETSPSPEEITRIGLLVCENASEKSEKFQFTHRTFAEFLVAEFLIENISKFNIYGDRKAGDGWYNQRKQNLKRDFTTSREMKNLKHLSEKETTKEMIFNDILDELWLNGDYSEIFSTENMTMIRNFIYFFWETRLYTSAIKGHSKKLLNFEKGLISSGIVFRNIFFYALQDGSDCMYKTLSDDLKNKLKSSDFWKPFGMYQNTSLMLSAEYHFFPDFLKFLGQFFDQRRLKEMLLDVDRRRRNVLWFSSSENFKFLLLDDTKNFPLTLEDRKNLLLAYTRDHFNVMQHFATEKSKIEFKKFYKTLQDFAKKHDKNLPKKLLLQTPNSTKTGYQTLPNYSLTNSGVIYYEEKFLSTLEIMKEILEKSTIKEMFKSDYYNRNFMILISSNANSVKVIEAFWNWFEQIFPDETVQASYLRQEDYQGFSAFDFSFCRNKFKEVTTFVKGKYENLYSIEEMRQRFMRLITRFLEPNSSDFMKPQGCLHLTKMLGNSSIGVSACMLKNVISLYPMEFVKSLFSANEGETLKQEYLNSSERFLKSFLLYTFEQGSVEWWNDVRETLEILLNIPRESSDFWKPFETSKKPKGITVLMLNEKNSSSSFLEFLKFMRNFIESGKLKEMFVEVDSKKQNFLFYCSLETLELALSDSEAIPLTREDKKKLLIAKNDDGLNLILYKATLGLTKEEFLTFFKIVEKFDEKLAEILLQDTNEHQPILYYCLSKNWEVLHKKYGPTALKNSLKILKKYLKPNKLQQMFNQRVDSRTPMMLVACQSQTVEYVKIFWDFFAKVFNDEEDRRSIMLQEEDQGFSAFDLVFWENECKEKVTFLKEKFAKILSEDEMRERIVRVVNFFMDSSNLNILVSRNWKSELLMENLISTFPEDFIRSLFLTNEDGTEVLNSSGKILRYLFFQTLSQIDVDEWWSQHRTAFEILFKILQESSDFINPCISDQSTILMLSSLQSSRSFMELLTLFTNVSGEEKSKEMLLKADKKNRNILWYCSLRNLQLILNGSKMISLTHDSCTPKKVELLIEDIDPTHIQHALGLLSASQNLDFMVGKFSDLTTLTDLPSTSKNVNSSLENVDLTAFAENLKLAKNADPNDKAFLNQQMSQNISDILPALKKHINELNTEFIEDEKTAEKLRKKVCHPETCIHWAPLIPLTYKDKKKTSSS